MRKVLLAAIAALAICMTAGSASASVLDFSYNYGAGDVVGGALIGTLAGNGNDFIIAGFQDFTVNGSPLVGYNPSIAFGSYDEFFGDGSGYSGNGSGTVTLNGSYMDFIAYDGTNGVDFLVDDVSAQNVYGNVTQVAGEFGNNFEAFNAADWTASIQGVPEPATLALFGAGLLGMGFMYRRRAVKRAA